MSNTKKLGTKKLKFVPIELWSTIKYMCKMLFAGGTIINVSMLMNVHTSKYEKLLLNKSKTGFLFQVSCLKGCVSKAQEIFYNSKFII